ncbi:MAG: rhodanese-like domain-containing protein [Salinibacterium sp.]|nr:rhodanese-like domain-containing protein [Salinibacterium sp.]
MELVAAGTVLLDVREQNEWDLGHAPDARLLPLSELQARLSDVPVGQQVLVICHSGMRSLRATAFLRAEGVDAVNVVGGMVAWAQVGGALTPNSDTV